MIKIKIAIAGEFRVGKDTVKDRIILTNNNFVNIAFADAMKRIFHDIAFWIPENPKPRKEYANFGDESRSYFGEDIWIRHVEKMIRFYERHYRYDGVIITDLRLPNEYEWAKENGYIIVRVTAPVDVRRERAKQAGDKFDESDLAHQSETFVSTIKPDYEIVNDGNLIDLYVQVDAMMSEIKGGD